MIARNILNELKRGAEKPLTTMKVGYKEYVNQWCENNLTEYYEVTDDCKINTENYSMHAGRIPDMIKFGTVCNFDCSGLGLSKDELLSVLPERIYNKLICWQNAPVTLDEIRSVCELKKYAEVYNRAGHPDINKKERKKNYPDDVVTGMKYDLDGNVTEIAYVNHYMTYVLLKFIESKGQAGVNADEVVKLAQKMVYPSRPYHPGGYYASAFQKRYNGPMVKYTDKVKMKTYAINYEGREFIEEHSAKFEK